MHRQYGEVPIMCAALLWTGAAEASKLKAELYHQEI